MEAANRSKTQQLCAGHRSSSVVDVPTAVLTVVAFLALNRWHGKLVVVAVVLGCGAVGAVLQVAALA